MDPSRYPESRCPTHQGLDSTQLQTTDLEFELHRLFNGYPCSLTPHRASASYPLNMAPTQYTTMYAVPSAQKTKLAIMARFVSFSPKILDDNRYSRQSPNPFSNVDPDLRYSLKTFDYRCRTTTTFDNRGQLSNICRSLQQSPQLSKIPCDYRKSRITANNLFPTFDFRKRDCRK